MLNVSYHSNMEVVITIFAVQILYNRDFHSWQRNKYFFIASIEFWYLIISCFDCGQLDIFNDSLRSSENKL